MWCEDDDDDGEEANSGGPSQVHAFLVILCHCSGSRAARISMICFLLGGIDFCQIPGILQSLYYVLLALSSAVL